MRLFCLEVSEMCPKCGASPALPLTAGAEGVPRSGHDPQGVSTASCVQLLCLVRSAR